MDNAGVQAHQIAQARRQQKARAAKLKDPNLIQEVCAETSQYLRPYMLAGMERWRNIMDNYKKKEENTTTEMAKVLRKDEQK